MSPGATPGGPAASVVVPVYRSEATLRPLVGRIVAALGSAGIDHEVLLVDDASPDRSWEVVAELAAEHPEVRGVRLAANAGQVGACLVGVRESRGDVVLTIDADLDNRPEDLLGVLEALRSGADLVGGRRTGRRPLLRSVASRLFNLRVRMAGFPFRDVGCGLDGMTRDLALTVVDQPHRARMLNFKPLLARSARRVVEVPVASEASSASSHQLRALVGAVVSFERTFGLGPVLTPAAVAGCAVAGAGLVLRRRVAGVLLLTGAAGAAALVAVDALRAPLDLPEVEARTAASGVGGAAEPTPVATPVASAVEG